VSPVRREVAQALELDGLAGRGRGSDGSSIAPDTIVSDAGFRSSNSSPSAPGYGDEKRWSYSRTSAGTAVRG
jgi:hypothetical protein